MTCEQLVRYLSEYIDRGLDERLRVEAEEHLATCENCSVVLDTTRWTITLFRESGQVEIPAGGRRRLMERLSAALRGPEPGTSKPM